MEILTRNRNSIITALIILLILAVAFNGMSGQTATSIILSGVTLAALYFLVASGVSLIFGLMDVLNFAHGSLFMFGVYAGWTFYTNPRLLFNTAPILLALVAGFALGPIIVGGAIRISYAILLGASLGFLGLGLQPPAADWGLMVSEARNFILIAPWMVLFPSLAIASLVVGANLFADGLSRLLEVGGPAGRSPAGDAGGR